MDLGGDQVTEFNTASGPLAWAHSNVFSAARLTATYDAKGLHYELADPLGTKRVQANIAGQTEMSWFSLPFGDALIAAPGPATATADDATEHHFTQKERDAESNNDYFLARYYNSNIGRFLTPDWSAKTDPVPYAVFTDPQSLNLYAYVRNNPITRVDPDGHQNGTQSVCNPGDTTCSQTKPAPAQVPPPAQAAQQQALTEQIAKYFAASHVPQEWIDKAATIVSEGLSQGVDPRITAAVLVSETGGVKYAKGSHNAFGLGAGKSKYNSDESAIKAATKALYAHIFGVAQQTTAEKLYSGRGNENGRMARGKWVQDNYAGYCTSGCDAAKFRSNVSNAGANPDHLDQVPGP